jgi:hypothetical protein
MLPLGKERVSVSQIIKLKTNINRLSNYVTFSLDFVSPYEHENRKQFNFNTFEHLDKYRIFTCEHSLFNKEV